jgi:hypothetical protein
MTRWTYDEVREIYKARDRYRNIVLEIAKDGRCLMEAIAFRGECGRDGQPQEGWCFICRAKAIVREDERALAAREREA